MARTIGSIPEKKKREYNNLFPHVITHTKRVSGSSVYTKKTDKKYVYEYKQVYGLNLHDFVSILGAEGAARIIKLYGGCSFYVPSIKTIRKRIRNCLIRTEFNKLLDEKTYPQVKIIEHLALKFKLSKASITLIVKPLSQYPQHIKDNKKDHIQQTIYDENLTRVMVEHIKIFKKYDIL